MSEKKQARPQTILKQGLKERGWTDAMIRDLLGEPDERVKRSPYSRKPPYCVYDLERVQAVERQPEFARRLAAAEVRRERALRVAADKLEKMHEWARTTPIRWKSNVPSDVRKIIKRGVAAWEEWQQLQENYDAYGDDADLETKKRWACNYLRHECLTYDDLRLTTYRQIGTSEAHAILHRRCLDMIRARFPELGA